MYVNINSSLQFKSPASTRGVARKMEKHRHKLFSARGAGVYEGPSAVPGQNPNRDPRAKSPEAHGLYNRKGDVFDHFGSAFNNMEFRLFCPFLTITLRTN